MEYLFFDIECANCNDGKGKICSFGYCLCNENFSIIEKEDIIINPQAPFCLNGGYSRKDYITLAYPESVFLSSPTFSEHYEKIKSLLTAKDTFIVGHAVGNDVNFLLSECERFNLPLFSYDFYDTQEIHRLYTKSQNSHALSAICAEFDIEPTILHRSDEDAFMTMQVAKKLCELANCDFPSLLKMYPQCLGTVENICYRREKKRQAKSFIAFIANLRVINAVDKSLDNKVFTFSKKLESTDYAFSAGLVQAIANRGGYYTFTRNLSDFYVMNDTDDNKHPPFSNRIKKIKISTLLDMLKLSVDSLEKIDTDTYLSLYKSFPHHKLLTEYKDKQQKPTLKDVMMKKNKH